MRGIYSPAFNSIRPFLISRQTENNASMWTTSIWQFGSHCGSAMCWIITEPYGTCCNVRCHLYVELYWQPFAVWQLSPRSFPISIHGQVSQSLKHTFRFMLQQRVLFFGVCYWIL